MLVSSSVVIQQKDNNVTHSGSGLLFSGSNYVFTSPIWFIRTSQQEKGVFSVSLERAGNITSRAIIKRNAILLTIAPVYKLIVTVQKLLQDVFIPDVESDNDITRLCSIAILQIKGSPLQCR